MEQVAPAAGREHHRRRRGGQRLAADGEEDEPGLVRDDHLPLARVPELKRVFTEHGASHRNRFNTSGSQVGKLGAFFVRDKDAVSDVEEKKRQGRLP